MRLPVVLRLVCAFAAALVVAPPAHAADGELVQVRGNPKIFRIVGGAPVWLVGECSRIDCSGRTMVDNLSGYGQYPRDGALSSGGSDGGTYRWAGGAPLWINRCTYGPGCGGTVEIDDNAY